MEGLRVKVRVLEHGRGLPLPQYMTGGAAGMDLVAAVASPVVLQPGRWDLIPTGLAMEIPQGYEGQVRPRSGLAAKHGITLVNAPGTIDSDYRGEVKVIVMNLGREDFVVERGMRIAQLVLGRVIQAQLEVEDELTVTARNSGGFGHTDTM